MKNKSLLGLLSFLKIFSEKKNQSLNQTKIFKTGLFSIGYPNSWRVISEKEIINFFPQENYGAVTVSSYKGIDFALEKTRNFILDMNGVDDEPEVVEMTKKDDTVEFLYEHSDKDGTLYTKAIRKNNDFFLLTINCDLGKWDAEKNIFFNIIDSFKIK